MTPPSDVQNPGAVEKRDGFGQLDWEYIENEDDNMLVKLEYPRLKREFLEYLQSHTDVIERIVAQHVRLLPGQHCIVAPPSDWLCGSFNACLPIHVSGPRAHRLLIKCPLPYRLGGVTKPRLLDEKVRSEAATFVWISQNCPRVPIPWLWGFGLPDGLAFTSVSRLPWYLRALEYVKRGLAWILRKPFHRPFVPRRCPASLKCGYLLMDFIDKNQGTMLSSKWPLRADATDQKQNLYRDLSRLMLNLAHPLCKIGSFTVHNDGEVRLSQRPLTLQLAVLENQGVPTEISPKTCYSRSDPYFHDLLRCHDLKLLHQPNSVRSKRDAEGQMAVLTIMRSLTAAFTQRDLQHGPFIFRLTDLHPSNIFVDGQCNIKAVVDLEWSCSLPIETQHPPFWLSGHELDEMEGENVADFDRTCNEFLDIFEQEDRFGVRDSPLEPGLCTTVMRASLEKKMHWYWSSLNEPRGMYNLFMDNIQPMFAPSHSERGQATRFQQTIAPYWCTASSAFIEDKVRDLQDYREQLRAKRREYSGLCP
ncbi:hypothetical protein AYO20_08871 [Fonsecaea nubica]|uniref:Aminoglycoside phosphotransferase domain-containing protein n=1 Tax=Fonsecaea nubica TaxID=856822 RepID=A0A178CMF0_9EURO|nr:hypothetical protein AYO20_08871 [Fonsecaea nubica]OAL30155.1 hypothetical protein AYO20_08871 [Fonsecaea nubica]